MNSMLMHEEVICNSSNLLRYKTVDIQKNTQVLLHKCSSISISKRKHVLSILFQVSAVNPHKTPLQGFFWNKNQIPHKKSQNKESESQTKMLDWRMWSWENEILLPSTQQVRKLGVGVLLQKYITTSYYNVPGISSTVALGVRSVTLVPSRHNRI